ncbi:MAG: phage shock protein PspC (stress-responsive transcriptional regulator) [Cyclobacteriaceae bacterium]|jgi:phage shock protein PspC (stress-responsive transcriptional regulator)
MKKNISINIGGIIFHIEEDSYDRLNIYLSSINKYFKTFEDSKEIIEDIESRIAEIFLTKLNDAKQVIIMEDIDELVQTMGTVADFEAQIEVDPEEVNVSAAPKEDPEPEAEAEKEEKAQEPKRLFRNMKQRVFGGVASGIAYYFKIDPIWVRLIMLALFFNLLLAPVSGTMFLIYLVLWIVLPSRDDIEEDKSYKKLYRNSDNRVLGGVSSGLASYFAADPTVFRLLFVLSIFLGGAGLILYVILWIITPEAKTITEKMQMQGERVTLSNIESNVKKSLNVKEGEENIFVKILLFPFRLISLLIIGLGKVMGPFLRFFVEAIRLFFGLLVSTVGVSMMVSFFFVWIVIIGLSDGWSEYMYLDGFPIDLLLSSFGVVSATAFTLVLFIPALALTLLGAIIIVRRPVGNAYLGWSLFGIWLFSLITASIMIPDLVRDYRTEEDVRTESIVGIAAEAEIVTLRLNPATTYEDYDGVDLKLRGHADSTYKLVVRASARGRDKQDARSIAEKLNYGVIKKNGDIYFDEEIQFDQQEFKFQKADVIFYIPFGQTFRMEQDLDEVLRNTLHLNGYRSYDMDGNDWQFDRSGIQCITCEDRQGSLLDGDEEKRRSVAPTDWEEIPGMELVKDFEDFNSLKISSLLDVRIIEGDQYKVALKGPNSEDVKLYKNGEQLIVRYKDNWDIWDESKQRRDVHLLITAPSIREIDISGGCTGTIQGLQSDALEISLDGASELVASMAPKTLDINLSGASSIRLEGTGKDMQARLDGASRLYAYYYNTERVDVEANGASKANVTASDYLDLNSSGVSQIRYRGDGSVNSKTDGLSTIKRD